MYGRPENLFIDVYLDLRLVIRGHVEVLIFVKTHVLNLFDWSGRTQFHSNKGVV